MTTKFNHIGLHQGIDPFAGHNALWKLNRNRHVYVLL
ncbi:hypothetical protein BH11ARM2_BH11ARM2_32970 [soil metagenome]